MCNGYNYSPETLISIANKMLLPVSNLREVTLTTTGGKNQILIFASETAAHSY